MKRPTIALLSILIGLTSAAQAVIIAQDTASDAAYAGGWTTGTNGGSGFQAWDIVPMDLGGSASIAANSSVNIPNSGPAFGLSTGELGASEWGLYGIVATRGLNSPMAFGDTFRGSLDNGAIGATGPGSGISFIFRNAAGAELTSIWVYQDPWYSSGANYQIGGAGDSGVALSTGGVLFALTPQSNSSFSLTLQPIGGSATTVNGAYTSGRTGQIASIDVRAYNNGAGTNGDFYVNNLEIEAVPEPATMAGLAVGLGFLVRRRRR